MKKLSIVLIVMALVLVPSSIFALDVDWAFAGNAKAGVKADFDANDYGTFYSEWASLKGTLTSEIAGEGDTYAEITIKARNFVPDRAGSITSYQGMEPYTWSAAIYSGDLKISLGSPDSVGAWRLGSRGYSSIDLDDDGYSDQAGVTPGFGAGNTGEGLDQGVAVTYDKITVGGMFRTLDDGTGNYDSDFTLVAKYADSMEGLDFNVEGAVVNSDLYGSAKVSTEIEGWSLWVASDMEVPSGGTFGMDATVGVGGAVEDVTLDAEAFYDINSEVLAAFAGAGMDLTEDVNLSARVYADDMINNFTLGGKLLLSNSTLIDGASLNLEYKNSDILNGNKGNIAAYAKVSL